MTEDKSVGWYHRLDGHEFEHALGIGDRQGSLACTIGVILFIAGIVIGVKEKSAFLAVVIILVSMIPIGLGNLILSKDAEEPTTAPVIEKSIADVAVTEIDTNEPTTVMETTTEEPETEPPETDALETEPPTQAERDYVVNTSSGKFHYPSCSSVKKMASHNRADYHCTRDELISYGYEPCGQCHP